MGLLETRLGLFGFNWVYLKIVWVHLGSHGFTLNTFGFIWVQLGLLKNRVGSFGFTWVYLKLVWVYLGSIGFT